MSIELFLNEGTIPANASGQIATGPLATEAKQDAAQVTLAALLAAAQGGVGSALTFYRVSIAQATTPGIKNLTAGLTLTGKVARLHGVLGTLHAAGTVQIAYDDDGAGTNAVALTGAITVDANAGPEWNFGLSPSLCPAGASGKHLTLVSATGAFNGFAVISLADA
jgi:hypothetical protein